MQPGSIARCVAGNRTQLTCVALLAKPAVTLTWMVGSDELLSCSPSSDDQVSDVTELDGRMNTSCSLTVLATRINHNKQYFCRATGKALPVPLLVHTRLDVLCKSHFSFHCFLCFFLTCFFIFKSDFQIRRFEQKSILRWKSLRDFKNEYLEY